MTTAHSKPVTVYKMEDLGGISDFIVMMEEIGQLQRGYYVYT